MRSLVAASTKTKEGDGDALSVSMGSKPTKRGADDPMGLLDDVFSSQFLSTKGGKAGDDDGGESPQKPKRLKGAAKAKSSLAIAGVTATPTKGRQSGQASAASSPSGSACAPSPVNCTERLQQTDIGKLADPSLQPSRKCKAKFAGLVSRNRSHRFLIL